MVHLEFIHERLYSVVVVVPFSFRTLLQEVVLLLLLLCTSAFDVLAMCCVSARVCRS